FCINLEKSAVTQNKPQHLSGFSKAVRSFAHNEGTGGSRWRASMNNDTNTVPEAALIGSLRDFRAPEGADLIGRVAGFYDWQNLRRQHEMWPYARSTSTAPQARCEARSDTGARFSGINFASQDYLSLSSHPA